MRLGATNAGWHLAALAAGAGVLLGFAYTLSPLTVVCLPIMGLVAWRVGRDLGPRERQWFFGLVMVAIVLRLSAVAALFLWADNAQPYATFFGDEQLFKNRSLWLRNIGMGKSISPADVIYAFEDVGESSYLYLLALVQALVGATPYGVHVLNITFYLTAVLVLYRLVRPGFGGAASLAGLGLLLFLPSLFVWSISALKEPAFVLVAALGLVCAAHVVRARGLGPRAMALAGVVASVFVLESVRRGGGAMAVLGLGGGLALGLTLPRPRLLLAAAVAVPLAVVAAVSVPAVSDRLMSVVRESAMYHAGHVVSSGHSYKLIDPRYYYDRSRIAEMPPRDAAGFVVRAAVSYFVEPVPWRAPSRALRAYLPEQMVWYTMLALVPIGLLAGFRRDPLVTSLIASHAGAVIMMVAVTSGNIGTLIRHRGLAVPYLAWLAGLGVVELIRTVVPAPAPAVNDRSMHANRG